MITFPKHVLEGYNAFATQRLPAEQNRYRELSVKGQFPEVMVIGCCDSRVAPLPTLRIQAKPKQTYAASRTLLNSFATLSSTNSDPSATPK